MVLDEQDKRLMEAHNFNRRLESAKERILRDRQIHPENEKKILQFTEYLKREGRSVPTQKHLVRLTKLALMLNKEFSMRDAIELKRMLNVFDATSIGIGANVGAGIFVVTGIFTDLAGPAVVLSVLILGAIASLCSELCELQHALRLI